MAAKQPPPLMKKHSQTDLVSRLKTRKILGVGGEDDDGEVHRSKVRGTGSPSVRRDVPGPTLGCSMLFPAVMRPLLQEGSQQICEMSSTGPPQHMDKTHLLLHFPPTPVFCSLYGKTRAAMIRLLLPFSRARQHSLVDAQKLPETTFHGNALSSAFKLF